MSRIAFEKFKNYGMELTSLRSVLQHHCPDLQNLTTSDLQDCKWPTKKKVFTALVTTSSVLQEQSEELAALNDDRNAESAFQKKQGVAREDRVESEMGYRTKFMRIVLSGLTKLRWPPTQEAFSDPIDLLFNDDTSFIDAVRFISQVGLPSMPQHHYRKEDAESPPKLRPHSGSRQKRGTVIQNESAFNSSISVIQNAESNDVPDVSELGISLQNVTGNQGAWGIAQQDGERVVHSPSEFGGHSHCAREKRADLNWKAFEVLQRQNEQLSVRLRELQLSVLRRDESEGKIAGILSELRSTVAEIADAGNVNIGDKKVGQWLKTGAGSLDNSFTTILRPNEMSAPVKDSRAVNISATSKEQEMEMFRQEAEREAQEQLANKDKIKSSGDAVPITSSSAKGKTAGKVKPAPAVARSSQTSDVAPPSSAAPAVEVKESPRASSYAQSQAAAAPSVLWSKLLGRVTSLEAQWTGAQRAARHLAEHTDRRDVSKGNALKGSPPLQRTGVQYSSSSASAAGTKFSAGLTPSRSVVNHSFGVQPALFSGGGAHGRHDGSLGNDGGDSVNSPPHPPFSSRASASGHSFSAISEEDRLGLDLSRIHLLQRDLVAFAENAFAWTADTVFPADSQSEQNPTAHSRGGRECSAQRPVVLSVNERALKRQQSALALQTTAWDLLLHLSCVSPIAPLALDSPLRSSMTGLDALIHEVSELAFPKIPKPAQMRLQAAADRALSEQVAVIRCWRQARSCLSQWTEHASAVAPTLQGVSKRYRSVVEQTAQELQEKSSSLSQITQALREAEVARIRSTAEDPNLTDTSSRSASFRGNSSASSAAGVPISPLDSLSRGSAGREVAALVNALRASKDELADSAQVVSTLGTKLVSELRRELELFSHTEGNLTSAVDTTQRLLQSSRPGANIGGTLQEEEPPSGAASAGLRKGTRRRAAETSSPKAGPTGSRKLVATPLSSRPAFDLSLS